MGSRDKRIDAQIKTSAAFAQPIMEALREMVHVACPDVEETMKWSRPHFDYKGPFCGMAAFKAHMTFGFWKADLMKAHGADAKVLAKLDRMESIKDLPSKRAVMEVLKIAVAVNDAGLKTARTVSATPKPVVIPPELEIALSKSKKIRAAFDAFSPSQRREYCDWVADAKREETKLARVEKAIAQIKEGKHLNWKYEIRAVK